MVGVPGFRPSRRDILLCSITFLFAWLLLGSAHDGSGAASPAATSVSTARPGAARDARAGGPQQVLSSEDKALLQKAKYLSGGFSLPGLPKLAGKFGWGTPQEVAEACESQIHAKCAEKSYTDAVQRVRLASPSLQLLVPDAACCPPCR